MMLLDWRQKAKQDHGRSKRTGLRGHCQSTYRNANLWPGRKPSGFEWTAV